MANLPKIGSKWISRSGDHEFRVIGTILQDGHVWVHYACTRTGKEFSCWVESFLERFTIYENQ